MDLSILLHPSPLSSSLRLLPPPIPRRHFNHRRHVTFRRRTIIPSASASASAQTPASIFGSKRELTGVQTMIDGMSPPARIASSVVLAAAAVAAGYGLALQIAGTKNAAVAGAAVLGAAGGAVVYKMNAEVPDVAAITLHNLVVGHDDPLELKREDVEGVAKRYGINKQDETFRMELCDIYSRFVYAILPPGGEDLKGNEVETIIKFKSGLGIDDPDAANVHLEIGRRIFRERLETGDPESDAAQRLAFQKLIYVSNLVFGDASTFLLPWKRLFKVTDAQVNIAIRENAKKLYSLKLNSVGRDIDANQLTELRKSQLLYKLSDEIATEMFREHTRSLVEQNIAEALSILKSRSRVVTGMPQVIEELEKVLAFNGFLTELTKHPEASQFACGVGPVSLIGGQYDSRNLSDIKLLYRAYALESFPDGRLDERKINKLDNLRNILGLGKHDAEVILLEIKSTVYKKRLSKAFNNELATAPSKAAFLQDLCEEVQFDPENASKLHEEIYRQKLQQLVASNELSKEDVDTLTSYQVRLCIPQSVVDAIHNDICGKLFAKVVDKAVSSGIKGFDADARSAVRKAAHGLRLSKDEAMAITDKAVRKALLVYTKQARAASNKLETAKELQQMIAFNSLVVTPLISEIKGEPISVTPEAEPEAEIKPETTDETKDEETTDESKDEETTDETEDEEEDEETTDETEDEETDETEDEDEEIRMLKDLEEESPKRVAKRTSVLPGQKEITLKDDIPYAERANLYEAYLHYCMTGDVTKTSFGLQLPTAVNDDEYLRLDQLGDILGLNPDEARQTRVSIAEKAFIKEAEVILADGQLTKAKVEQLTRLQNDVKLPEFHAQNVIKNILRNKMAASLEVAVKSGRMGMEEVRELKEANVNINDVMSEALREKVFKKAAEEVFTNGKGEFDETEMYDKLTKELSIDKEKAKKVVQEIAKPGLGSSLVQAISQLRQKNPIGVVNSLNDMLACDMATPAEGPVSWSSPAELDDLYCIYLKSIPKPEKLSRLQNLLGMSDEKAFSLQDAAREGALPLASATDEEEEEEFAF